MPGHRSTAGEANDRSSDDMGQAHKTIAVELLHEDQIVMRGIPNQLLHSRSGVGLLAVLSAPITEQKELEKVVVGDTVGEELERKRGKGC